MITYASSASRAGGGRGSGARGDLWIPVRRQFEVMALLKQGEGKLTVSTVVGMATPAAGSIVSSWIQWGSNWGWGVAFDLQEQ